MEVKITKKTLLDSYSTSVCSGDWWLINGRIYNDDKTRYCRFRFVLWFDPVNDMWDSETETEILYDDYMWDSIWAFCDCLGYDYDEQRIYRFVDKCNDSIEMWNDHVKRCA